MIYIYVWFEEREYKSYLESELYTKGNDACTKK
jgi:hypothetical protein